MDENCYGDQRDQGREQAVLSEILPTFLGAEGPEN